MSAVFGSISEFEGWLLSKVTLFLSFSGLVLSCTKTRLRRSALFKWVLVRASAVPRIEGSSEFWSRWVITFELNGS